MAGLGLLSACGSPPLQSQARSPRIGFLAGSSAEGSATRLAAFREGLRDLGYAEGTDYTLESRYAAGDAERLPELAAELLRLGVDILVVQGTTAAQAAKQATSTVPIVIGNATDPVGAGLVASLARPGGNVTGLSDFNRGVVTKRLELLKAAVPSASLVAVLLDPTNPAHPLQLGETEAAAPALGVALLPLQAEDAAGVDRAFAVMRQQRPDALIVFGFSSARRQIVEFTAQARLPAMYPAREDVAAGGLMSYGTNLEDLYRRAASHVDRILKGAKPADLPVEQPTRFDFVINLKTAQAIGLTIPQSVLQQATEVIQ